MRANAVTAELRESVLRRDGGCVAPRIRCEWVNPCVMTACAGRLTLDHVKDQPRLGKRAPSDAAHLVTLCAHHHLDGWATAHRPELRAYLRSFHEEVA